MANRIITLPATGTAKFQINVTLDDVPLTLQFIWNSREAAFFMTVLDENNDLLVSGHKVVVDWTLLQRYRDIRLPPGKIWVIRTDDDIQPTIENFGSEVILVYEEAS
jgi:hypothetical protein